MTYIGTFAINRTQRPRDQTVLRIWVDNMSDTFSVFVSYSTRDAQHLEIIRGALRGLGARRYIAKEDVTPGAQLSKKIRARIEECDVFLLLLTENSRSSSFVHQETGHALDCDRRFIFDRMLPRRGKTLVEER